jgi:hypothetical protein
MLVDGRYLRHAFSPTVALERNLRELSILKIVGRGVLYSVIM